MTKDLNLETVNRALGIEVRKLQEEMKAADKEILRLRAGGCARDQSTTQFCAEAAEKDARMHRMMFKMERWRGSLMNIAQGRGDPVAVACAALEADND